MNQLRTPVYETTTRMAIITFLECELRGYWTRLPLGDFPQEQDPNWTPWKAELENAGSEVWLVRSDGLKRAWKFKQRSIIRLGQSAIRFHQDDVVDEIAVDEDIQAGKSPRSTVI